MSLVTWYCHIGSQRGLEEEFPHMCGQDDQAMKGGVGRGGAQPNTNVI